MSVRQAPVSFYEKGKQMKKGEILEGVVKELRFPNKGILEIEGAPVVVKNAVPGQKIRFSVTKARSGRGEGRLILKTAGAVPIRICPMSSSSR